MVLLDCLDGLHAFGGRTLLTLNQIEFHLLTLGEGLKALTTDGGVMDKDVTGIGLDESEALGVVEPLDGSRLALRHGYSPVFGVCCVGRLLTPDCTEPEWETAANSMITRPAWHVHRQLR